MIPQEKEVHITTGDVDGVGLEVTLKALKAIKTSLDTQIFVHADQRYIAQLKSKKKNVTWVSRADSPVEWVLDISKRALKYPKKVALVTGPLSKSGIKQAGYNYIGHTEILKQLSKKRFLFQTYLGSKANILLMTDHIPMSQVSKTLSSQKLVSEALKQALKIHRLLEFKGNVALLGLDPHAGEEGIIGTQDMKIKKWVHSLRTPMKSKIIGPLPADSAFSDRLRSQIGLYVALYHDQGLIPFKTLHGFGEGVHLTAGLPFVRTSVDHGTAKELHGKNIADPGSMKDAIKTAIKLIGKPL